MTDPRDKRRIDDIEELAGQRSFGRERQAVRIEQLQPLLELPQQLQSAKAAGAAPTKAEFDKLVADLDNVYKRLFECQNLLRKALLNQS